MSEEEKYDYYCGLISGGKYTKPLFISTDSIVRIENCEFTNPDACPEVWRDDYIYYLLVETDKLERLNNGEDIE